MHGHAHRGCGCGCGPREQHHPVDHAAHHHWPGEDLGGSFGVRRPLRFLAWKLQLDEAQVAEFATILNELKTERAQAAVDDRRALALLADAAQADAFDRPKADEAAKLRITSHERLQRKVADSLGRMHAVLSVEQRRQLAYLLRTGTLMM